MDDKLMSQLEMLDECLNLLEQIQKKTLEEYLEDKILQGAAERYLQIAIETRLNIGNRILSLYQLKYGNIKAPKTYADVFTTLALIKVIPEDFAKKLVEMAGMRNLLVHVYWEINDELVYRTIQSELDDFRKFRAYVMSFLKEENL